MKLIKLNSGTQPECLKKMATLCLVSGGIALMLGAVIVQFATAVIIFSLACFIAAIVLVLWAQIGRQG